LRKPEHRIAGAREQRVEHGNRRQLRVQRAIGLRGLDPAAERVADRDQPVEIAAVVHQRGAQGGVLVRQRGHLAGQLHLHRPAHHGAQLVDRLLLGRHRRQEVLRALHEAHHRRGGEVFLAGKVLVEAGLGDADGGGDLVDRHRFEALFGQQAVRRLHDGLFAGLQHLLLERGLGGGGGGGHAEILVLAVAGQTARMPKYRPVFCRPGSSAQALRPLETSLMPGISSAASSGRSSA
jgi:hypothetical protein